MAGRDFQGGEEPYSSAVLDQIARSYVSPQAGYTEETESVLPSAYGVQDEPQDHGEKLSNLLEQNSAMMRRNMMDFFREARASYLKEQRQALDAERRSGLQRLQVKQEEVEILKDELAVALNALRDADTVVWRACTQISCLRERFRERNFVQAMFVQWLGQIRWDKREKLLVAKADRWRKEEWYMRRTLKTMWQNVARKKKKLVDQAVQAARDEVTANVTRAKDDESAALHQQLLETKRALAVEKHAREMLAQDMKRSFMRGVCALNMEAMQVMKRGVAPGGINPNPSLFPMHPAPADPHAPEAGEPEPEAIPESIQNMMASMNFAAPSMPAEAHPQPRATSKPGSMLSGYVVRGTRSSPGPGPRTSLPNRPSLY